MKNRYNKYVLKKLNQVWMEYKAKTGSTQVQMANAMGIKQSAFSQYLRGSEQGGIPLNSNFITKFAALTQVSLTEFGLTSGIEQQRPEAFSMELKYTLSGTILTDKYCPVQSIVPKRNCYAVLVDMEGFILHKGSLIIVDPDDNIREHDGVICKTSDGPIKVGQIINAEDGWKIISPVWGNVLSFKADDEQIVNRIIGNYYPEGSGKVYKLKT